MIIKSKNSIYVLVSLLIFALILVATSLYAYITENMDLGLYAVINAAGFIVTNIFAFIFSINAIKRKETKAWVAYTYLVLVVIGVIWAAIDL